MLRKGVAVRTVSFRGWSAASRVLQGSHRIHVLWVAAGSVATEVVQEQAVLDGSNQQLIDNPM